MRGSCRAQDANDSERLASFRGCTQHRIDMTIRRAVAECESWSPVTPESQPSILPQSPRAASVRVLPRAAALGIARSKRRDAGRQGQYDPSDGTLPEHHKAHQGEVCF